VSGVRLTIVGGGTAALEGLLMARELLGADASLCLLAPEREFRYRPINPDAPFRPVAERGLPIAEIVEEVGADWVVDRASAVDQDRGVVLTRDGDTVGFDHLLLAAGGRARPTLRQSDLWIRGGDPSFLDEIIAQLRSEHIHSAAVVVPRGARWSVPAYELALVLAWSSGAGGGRVTLATAEAAPLAALGAPASELIAQELDGAGVELLTGVELIDSADHHGTRAGGRAQLVVVAEEPQYAVGALMGRPSDPARMPRAAGAARRFDRVVALPTMIGPHIGGVSTDEAGFVETDETLRVRGSEHVWGAGSCLAASLEHSALAARQADGAVASIAAAVAGEAPAPQPAATQLVGILLSGQRERWLAENPAGTAEPSTRCLWWPPGRAVGRLLAERIARRDPLVESALPTHPDGLTVRASVTLERAAASRQSYVAGSDEDLRRDIQQRQERALALRAREANATVRALETRLETLAARQQQTIRELQQQGYLRGRG
jgi:sulfide:quinone oxidoreductase